MDDLPTERTDDEKWNGLGRVIVTITWLNAMLILNVAFFS